MPHTAEQLIEAIREEFTKILAGPGVSWDKRGMQAALERALANALMRFTDIY